MLTFITIAQIIFVLQFSINLCYSETQSVIKIEHGTIQGKLWKSRKGRPFVGFTGIPYAKPPINELRFEAPVRIQAYEDVINATGPHAVCPQLNSNEELIGNEDCLFLNVYTPQVDAIKTKCLYPVIVYIHGGSFVVNSASYDWLGPEILLDKDIILVTVNYRLGAVGFLSTGDDVVPGNNGLKDQALALEWVHDNIRFFGGNTSKVTIMGNSAGSSSAQYHTISPLSKHLIQGAIFQSGSAIAPFAISSKAEAIRNAYKLGEYLNCSTINSIELVKCLRNVNIEDILRQQSKYMFWDMDITIPPFRPVVEINTTDAFLPASPTDTLNTKFVADIPVMMGMVIAEGAYQAGGITTNEKNVKEMNYNFNEIVNREFNLNRTYNNSAQVLKKFYFGDDNVRNTSKQQLSDLYTDGWFLKQLDFTISAHVRNRKSCIYLYLFNYRGSISYASLYDTTYDYGAAHTDELIYLLPRRKTFPNYTSTVADDKVSDVLTTLWSNFAHYGNPTPRYSKLVPWRPTSNKDLKYYHIKNGEDLSMQNKLFLNRTRLWRSISTIRD